MLAATLASVGTIPVAGIMLIFGIDRFMSTARALTNACGNAVGSFVVAAWEGVLNRDRARAVIAGVPFDEDHDEPGDEQGPARPEEPALAGA